MQERIGHDSWEMERQNTDAALQEMGHQQAGDNDATRFGLDGSFQGIGSPILSRTDGL